MAHTLKRLCLGLIVVTCSSHAADPPPETSAVREQLQAFLDGKLPPDQLTITYTDLHGLYGGLSLTIRGTGEVQQKAVRQQVPEPQKLTPTQVTALVQLLIEQQAWRQETPQAVLLPDESRATLKIAAGKSHSAIWERIRELKSNRRLMVIREQMQKSAWPQPADP
jgi:hypothetical protein